MWVADAKIYVDLFLPAESRKVLLSLLDTDARAIVLQYGILDEEITDDTFTQIRSALTMLKNLMLLQFQFQTRVQQPDEPFDVYVPALRRLVNDAFPELPRETGEKVLHQIHVGHLGVTAAHRSPTPDQQAPISGVVAEFLGGQQSAATVITAGDLVHRPGFADTTAQVSPRVLNSPYLFAPFMIMHCPHSHF
ncbi:unnamed protein product [Echinostoma caproni]|uniref:Uncharacterized protein n=1 Tax=Echinostoma caproni TaxID=27848 RepID=A0A3P8H3N8_9TREM|nr:unnamed protein product [Echinostoma caproni]